MDYWVVRGLAVHAADSPRRKEYCQALLKLAHSESPSVATAACDGLLAAGDKAQQRVAIDRLIELANVDEFGHYAAVEALNVLDMNADLSAEDRSKIAALPRKAAKPPARADRYAGALIDHVTSGK
jgi:uncharacterized sulfatase